MLLFTINSPYKRHTWLVNMYWSEGQLSDTLIKRDGITVTALMSATTSQITGVLIVYQPLVQAQIKENVKTLRHWPLCGEITGDWWIPCTKSQWCGIFFPFDDVIMCFSIEFETTWHPFWRHFEIHGLLKRWENIISIGSDKGLAHAPWIDRDPVYWDICCWTNILATSDLGRQYAYVTRMSCVNNNFALKI